MHVKIVVNLLAAVAFALASTAASASLLGQSVTGSLTFAGDPGTDYFGPSTRTVGAGVEFAADFEEGPLTADFTSDSLVITNSFAVSGNPSVSDALLRFTPSTADLFGLFSILSSNQPNGIAVELDGDTLEVLIVGGAFEQGVYTTTIVFDFPAVPEPSGLALAGLALLAMVLARRPMR